MSLLLSIKGFFEKQKAKALVLLAPLLFCACGGKSGPSDAEKARAALCRPSDAAHTFIETPFYGGKGNVLSFEQVRANINSACATCHQFPSKTGGFTYGDWWESRTVNYNGSSVYVAGIADSAQKLREYIFIDDPEKRMPPKRIREKNPEAFIKVGQEIDAWLAAGKPKGTFKVGDNRDPLKPVKPVKGRGTSDLGDCVPSKSAIGFDYKMDRWFEATEVLPKFLVDTDLFSLDPLRLAQRGTFAYNVEYPLWADNADKGRWIHVPMKFEKGELLKQSIEYNEQTEQFKIPDNTRFYKTFYKAVTLPNKQVQMRRIETRVIVARTPWEKSLFGTYQWDETEQIATLVDAPYRDGSPWKDVIFDLVTDIKKQSTTPYAIPGRQRCVDCHMGGPMNNFVIGFTPLQINKRAYGEGGRVDWPSSDDLNQVRRFISYGLVTGVRDERDLPVLEKARSGDPRNIWELRANGYTVGNCFHCHNPDGLAFKDKDLGVTLELGPGDLFQFSTARKSVEMRQRRLVHQQGDLDSSQLWRKVFDPPAQQGMFSQMPMHTPYVPDCRLLTFMGKWIRSFESNQAAEVWEPPCKKSNPWTMIDLDFTWPDNGVYTPRRNDWADVKEGMSTRYRELQLTPDLKQSIQTKYPVGWWLDKPECKFPEVNLPPEERRPWMLSGDQPKRPLGQVYSTTPGAYFFRTTCMKCHGPRADGVSSLASGILNWSGGKVRVANLIDGLFGKQSENTRAFDLNGKNYAAQYLIWMAMEGTRVQFPPELGSYMGKHGGQMLNGIREKCLRQISSDKPSSPQFTDHEVYNKVCFMQNLHPGHPDLAFDPQTNEPLHPEKVEEWLDRGAFNAGFAIYDFLFEAGKGNWLPDGDQCEKVYPKQGAP